MLWCGMHLPSKVAERKRKRDEAYRAKRDAETRRWRHDDELRQARADVIDVAKRLISQKANYDDLVKAVTKLETIEAGNEG